MQKKTVTESREDLMARLGQKKQKSLKEKPENKVKQEIRDYLNQLMMEGYKVEHLHYSARGGKPGVGDRICCIEGQFVSIEVKRPSRKTHKNGGLSDNQLDHKRSVQSAGGHHITAYSQEDVGDYLQKHFGLPSR
jgi:hypothetical protein